MKTISSVILVLATLSAMVNAQCDSARAAACAANQTPAVTACGNTDTCLCTQLRMVSTCFEACAADPALGAVRTAITTEADKRCAGTGNAAVDIPKILAGTPAPTTTAKPTATGTPSSTSTSSSTSKPTTTGTTSNAQAVRVGVVMAALPLAALML